MATSSIEATQPVLAIDFDGVLHDAKNPIEGRRMGPPMPDAIEGMKKLQSEGYRLIIHSVRAGNPKHIEDWCKYYGVPYDEVTNVKPIALWYIDDRGIRFRSWLQLVNELRRV